MAKAQDELVFVALGGVGEIGMNMAAYGFGPEGRRKWIVVDCGVSFGGPQQPGIELIMADPSFLEEVADDVLALVLTHSHEDHYGAVLDLWPAFDRPVYATAFTAAMLSAKRATEAIVENVRDNTDATAEPEDIQTGRLKLRLLRAKGAQNGAIIALPVGQAITDAVIADAIAKAQAAAIAAEAAGKLTGGPAACMTTCM